MKKMKILLCGILLLSILAVGAFAGGGGQGSRQQVTIPTRSNFNPASFPAHPANYVIGILTISHTGEIIASDHPAVSQIEEHTGFRINLQYMLNANYNEQMNTRLAAGDMPGIVAITGNTSVIADAALAGAFWDITEIYDMYPYLSTLNRDVMNNVSIQGRNFGIYRERAIGRAGMVYRVDWLRNLGLSEPRTLDELYNVLRAFTFNDPDRNGLNDTFGIAWAGTSMAPFYDIAVMFGAPNRWGIQNGQLVPWFEYPEFREALEWNRRLFVEGIVANRDFPATSTNDFHNFIRENRVGWHINVNDEANRASQGLFNNGLISEQAAIAGDHIWVMGSVANSRGQIFSPASNGHAGYVTITTTGARTFQDLHYYMQFLDACNSPMGSMILSWGAQDVNWYWNPDGVTFSLIPANQIPNGWHILEGWNQFRMRSDLTPSQLLQPIPARQGEVTAINMTHVVHDPTLPLAMMSETWMRSSTSLNQIIDDAVVNFMLGNLDMAGFQREVERWYREGGRQAIVELQAAYDAARR